MGQIALRPKSGQVEDAALALERLVPQDIVAVAPGRQRYAQFTNDDGGIIDDLIVTRLGDELLHDRCQCRGECRRGRGASALDWLAASTASEGAPRPRVPGDPGT